MKILAVFAHPDDESCLAGGTLALFARAGADITLVTATRGEAGGCHWCEGAVLGAVRQRELENAARALGIARVIWLGCSDGALEDCDAQIMAGRIEKLMRQDEPQIILTLPLSSLDDHPDHRAVGRWTQRAYVDSVCDACQLFYALNPERAHAYPGVQRVDIRAVTETKLRAVKCHQSQVECWHKALENLQTYGAFEYWLPFSDLSKGPHLHDFAAELGRLKEAAR